MIRGQFVEIAIRELKPKYGRHRAKKLAWQLLKAIERMFGPTHHPRNLLKNGERSVVPRSVN